MIIELGDNGLRAKYHWRTFNVSCESDDPAFAAYLAVRELCPFLTDDNHDWKAKDYGPPTSIHHERLREVLASSRYSIVVYEKLAGQDNRYWFHFAYRVPGQAY